MDELAQAAKVPPDEFRRRHLDHDPRALAVLKAALELAGGLDGPRGMAIARYKNRQCCAAVVVDGVLLGSEWLGWVYEMSTRDIFAVRFVQGPAAALRYGHRGGDGVLFIETRVGR